MEDENLYDEFGNYIGPEMDASDGSDSDSQDSDSKQQADGSNDSSSYAYEKPVSIRKKFFSNDHTQLNIV